MSSAVHFALPGAAMVVAFWFVRPGLEDASLDPLAAYLVAVCLPLAGLLVAALVGYRAEGRRLEPEAIASRMRYQRPEKAAWRATIVAIAVAAIGSLLLTGIVPAPAGLPPFLDPTQGMTTTTLNRAVDGGVAGRLDLAALFTFTFCLNIVGEELWWRGYVLPRQELAFGDRTWMIHGTLWTGFHLFKWWEVIPLLPMGLVLAHVSQRQRNSWPALIAHAVLNAVALVTVVVAVASSRAA